jgi:hypothetical protein
VIRLCTLFAALSVKVMTAGSTVCTTDMGFSNKSFG